MSRLLQFSRCVTRGLDPMGVSLGKKHDLSAVMPAKAGIQEHMNVRFDAEAVPLAEAGDYWIVRLRGR